MKSARILLAALVAMSAGPQVALAGMDAQAATAEPVITLSVCNRSGEKVNVAASYVKAGEDRFINRGWFEVLDGACREIDTTNNGTFYFYAEVVDGSGRQWAGNHNLCVSYPGPYSFYSTDATRCRSSQMTLGFVGWRQTQAGPFTWTIQP
jgi:uncharacterized membrane protein